MEARSSVEHLCVACEGPGIACNRPGHVAAVPVHVVSIVPEFADVLNDLSILRLQLIEQEAWAGRIPIHARIDVHASVTCHATQSPDPIALCYPTQPYQHEPLHLLTTANDLSISPNAGIPEGGVVDHS